MKNKGLIATIIVMSGVIVTLTIVLLLVKMPSVWISNKIETETETETTEIETTESTEAKPELTTSIEKYTGYKGNVHIEYPVIYGIEDADLLERLNYKIKTNALSIVSLYPISTALQTLNISCEVHSLDEDKITIFYSGRVLGKGIRNYEEPVTNDVPIVVAPITNNTNLNPSFSLNPALAPTNNNSFQTNNFSSMPLPSNDQSNVKQDITVEKNKGLSKEAEEMARDFIEKNNTHTADAGPTSEEVKSPTAPYKQGAQVDNMATNTPNAQYGPGYVNKAQAPTADANLNSNPNLGAPVFGQTGTNTSASTIDQQIFYTNTMDIKNCVDIHLSQFADCEALAKYARSNDVEFVNIDSSKQNEVRKYIRKTIQKTLAEQLKAADFRNEALTIWPKSFSYRDTDGTIYFTVKLSSKLGNYAIIKYKK